MNHKYFFSFFIYLGAIIFISAVSDKNLKKELNSKTLSFKDAEHVLMEIKNPDNIPDTQIKNALITIVDDNYITATIKCDTLIKNNRKPTILKGNVVATFYNDSIPVSFLRSDFAEYQQKISLIAKKILLYTTKTLQEQLKILCFLKISKNL